MAVQRTGAHLGLLGNFVQAGFRAIPGERLLGYLQNAVAIPLRIGARFSGGGLNTLGGHWNLLATGDSLR